MLPRLMRPVGSSDLMPSSPTSSTDDIVSVFWCAFAVYEEMGTYKRRFAGLVVVVMLQRLQLP